MLRAGYSLVLWLALPFLALRLWLRSRREPGFSRGLAERFGSYKIDSSPPLIWVHAVSVGEVRASVPLVSENVPPPENTAASATVVLALNWRVAPLLTTTGPPAAKVLVLSSLNMPRQ